MNKHYPSLKIDEYPKTLTIEKRVEKWKRSTSMDLKVRRTSEYKNISSQETPTLKYLS